MRKWVFWGGFTVTQPHSDTQWQLAVTHSDTVAAGSDTQWQLAVTVAVAHSDTQMAAGSGTQMAAGSGSDNGSDTVTVAHSGTQ
jgi:hypothetical protein